MDYNELKQSDVVARLTIVGICSILVKEPVIGRVKKRSLVD